MYRQRWASQRNPVVQASRQSSVVQVLCSAPSSKVGLLLLLWALISSAPSTSSAAPPRFPPLDTARSIHGELVSADFIHRTGELRNTAGELVSFSMPPYAIMTYQGAEADLRDVPLGTELEFLFLPDDEGAFTQLVATRLGQTPDEAGRKQFIAFTKERGVAGWIDDTQGKTVTVTFFSGAPEDFANTWGDDFSAGQDVRVCVANDELRTWNVTSTAERGKILRAEKVPITGYGCSGWRVVVEVSHMLEGFRQGRIVRIFGPGWKVENQLFRECLVNYGYQAPRSPYQDPDFSECEAKHYPEHFPYRTDYSNKHLPWFQYSGGELLPLHSEHRMLGELTKVDAETQSGEFKTEQTGKVVKFTMFGVDRKTPVIRFQTLSRQGRKGPKLEDLPLGLRYRFHMYQDANGNFSRCIYISDEASQLVINSVNYQIQDIDLPHGRIAVTWQGLLVQNYQKEKVSPPPYGHSLLAVTPQTRVWKDEASASLKDLRNGDKLRINLTSEQPNKPAYCTDLWIVEDK